MVWSSINTGGVILTPQFLLCMLKSNISNLERYIFDYTFTVKIRITDMFLIVNHSTTNISKFWNNFEITLKERITAITKISND